MNPCNELSIRAAMRYWGCASQAGVRVTGGFYADTTSREMNEVKEVFSPLALSNLPSFHPEPDINWSTLISAMAHETKLLLEKDDGGGIPSPVEFNLQEKKVTFLLPGFDKAEIKLSQVTIICHAQATSIAHGRILNKS
jgi:arsenite-transporting ATPase